MHPIVLLILLVAVLAFVSWYRRAPGPLQKKVLMRVLLVGGGGLLLVALLTGRLHPLFAALAAAVPIVYRLAGLVQVANTFKAFGNQFRSAGGPSPGKSSEVETRYLRMRLNHDTGEMDGDVLEGPYRGRRYSNLSLEELLELHASCRDADPQSAAVLEAYLDRTHGDEWRERAAAGAGGGRRAGNGAMSEQEAREILGVGAQATRDEIVDAHRRLMQKLHPQWGASTYLAAKLNEAKDVLTGR